MITRQLQLALLKIVLGSGRPLPFGRQTNFGANHIDAGDDAALPQRLRLAMQRVGGLELRFRGRRDRALVAMTCR